MRRPGHGLQLITSRWAYREGSAVLRILVAALLLSGWTFLAAAAEAPSRRAVDLDEPGVLERLQRSNPSHYYAIRRILEGVLKQPDAGVPRWIQTTFNARDVKYVPIVLTSHPAKRRLSFALDATRYEVVVVLTNVRGDIVPAK
jgi:hypothetical protein